jgi:hypothetical protein
MIELSTQAVALAVIGLLLGWLAPGEPGER